MPQIVDRACEAVIALLMAVIIGLVVLAVGFRYVLASPIAWAEELARLCLVWVSFLGVYIAHRRAQHITVTAVFAALPPSFRTAVRILLGGLMLLLIGALTWFGSRFALRFMDNATPLLGIPTGVTYAAMPVSMALLLIDLVITLGRDWARFLRGEADQGKPS
ncbi:TRAP transporter small permease [Rhodoligotrophos defluvii]|uniref:TRAP transporter small permease n=1 Tax=Rhodoligotrophos defluvii TaxID=2561934 RepID=UPI0010C9F66F|nr:TRAP transporter small permease [Rhodoligotrophos defluvii]